MLNKPGKAIIVTVADVMNSKVISVSPESPLDEVIKIFTTYDLSGIPVVDAQKNLLGIITQYDLVTKGSGLHIPTLIKTLDQSEMLKAEKMILEETLKPLKKLTAKDIMNDDPLFLYEDEPIEEALRQFSEHHRVNPIIVVNKEKRVVGVLSRHDLIKILALKELGRTIDAVIERVEKPKKAETTISKTIEKFRKEFLLLPRYKKIRWIIFGAIIFLIGTISSFLFIVKLPDYNFNRKANITNKAPIEKSVEMVLESEGNRVSVGEDVPIKIALKIKKETVLKRVDVVIKYEPSFLAVIGKLNNLDSAWQSAFGFVNLENNTINLSWIATPPLIFSPREINLGVISFRAIKRGETRLILDVSAGGNSRALDINGNDVLEGVFDLSLNII